MEKKCQQRKKVRKKYTIPTEKDNAKEERNQRQPHFEEAVPSYPVEEEKDGEEIYQQNAKTQTNGITKIAKTNVVGDETSRKTLLQVP